MMKTNTTRLRVRYPETDRMGIVHHTNHIVWFEIGRTELLRDLGTPYAALEADSLLMPVIEVGVRYRKPARYDDEVDVETYIEDVTGASVRFGYRLTKHPGGELIATGYTLHAMADERGVPRRLPPHLRERLEAIVEDETRAGRTRRGRA